MINYKKGKRRYKINSLGSLFIDEEKLKDTNAPIIYIGGQLEHRIHLLEKSGYTPDTCFNMFTGNWSYDYPITTKNKKEIDTIHFANTFIQLLELSKLDNVKVITTSYGGMIGAYITKSKRISRVIAVHPPILGTILANPNLLNIKDKFFNNKERLIIKLSRLIVNNKFGFEQDNYKGIDLSRVDLNKLTVIGSNLNPQKDRSILKEGYKLIRKITGRKSDGIVILESNLFANKGIDFIEEDSNYNHSEALSENNLKKIYNLTKKL